MPIAILKSQVTINCKPTRTIRFRAPAGKQLAAIEADFAIVRSMDGPDALSSQRIATLLRVLSSLSNIPEEALGDLELPELIVIATAVFRAFEAAQANLHSPGRSPWRA